MKIKGLKHSLMVKTRQINPKDSFEGFNKEAFTSPKTQLPPIDMFSLKKALSSYYSKRYFGSSSIVITELSQKPLKSNISTKPTQKLRHNLLFRVTLSNIFALGLAWSQRSKIINSIINNT